MAVYITNKKCFRGGNPYDAGDEISEVFKSKKDVPSYFVLKSEAKKADTFVVGDPKGSTDNADGAGLVEKGVDPKDIKPK